MDGVRRATAANLTGATTIEAEILNANMVSQGVRQVPISCYVFFSDGTLSGTEHNSVTSQHSTIDKGPLRVNGSVKW